MIRIELLNPSYNGKTLEWERLAIIEATGREVTWREGSEGLLDMSAPVANLRTREFIKFEDDPEEWVRGLPTMLRSGEIVVHVLEDTNPLPADVDGAPDDGDAPLNITPVDYNVHA